MLICHQLMGQNCQVSGFEPCYTYHLKDRSLEAPRLKKRRKRNVFPPLDMHMVDPDGGPKAGPS